MRMTVEFALILFAVVGAVVSYAAGYFRERLVPEPPDKDPELPTDPEDSLRALLNAYGEEVRAKYLRNHFRRKAEKLLKEFSLASFHFVAFTGLVVACSTIDALKPALDTVEILTGLVFLTLALKAGQLTASKETVERKELILIHHTELINLARDNFMSHSPRDQWVSAMSVRDEKSPLHY
jgi:hypothetical protein